MSLTHIALMALIALQVSQLVQVVSMTIRLRIIFVMTTTSMVAQSVLGIYLLANLVKP